MSLPPPQTKEFVDRLTSLAVECREELSQGTQSIQEIDLLLRQTQQEIDRLSQREQQQNAKLRELESSIESFSRSQIRDAYVASHEVQMRLFMMRSQIEQLESRRKSIVEHQEKLRILLDLAEINRESGAEEADTRTKILPGTDEFGNGTDSAAEIIDAQERERMRIARQLTDGPAQVMANTILRTQILARVAERSPEQLSEEIQELESLTSHSLMDIRRTIFEMRPLVLEELGLVGTLQRYTKDFAREHGASIVVDGPEDDENIDRHARIALFRLIQQAIVAMVAPDAGTQVHVSIQFEQAQLLVRLDASSVGENVPKAVGRFVEDSYTGDTLELIDATIQRESFSNSERISIVIPLGDE